MTRKVLFTASTFSHIQNFHLPYLEYFRNNGWIVHVACGGESAPVPHTEWTLAPRRRPRGQSSHWSESIPNTADENSGCGKKSRR